MNLSELQREIAAAGLDGWLFYDHHHRDPLAYRILDLSATLHASRRWYYLIPAEGAPRGLMHRIEPRITDALPGTFRQYSQWSELVNELRTLLQGCRRVAMQYSPDCAIPYISLVDAGTVEMVQRSGVEIASSADLVQLFEARWSEAQYDSHIEAGRRVDAIRKAAFDTISEALRTGRATNEFEIRSFILESFEKAGLYTDHGPIVAVNAHASDPHYEPGPDRSSVIRTGDFVLIDMWAKLSAADSVYYDITWTGFCAPSAPEPVQTVFHVVRDARDAGVRALREGVATRGCDVDDAVRGSIRDAGYENYFIHRTGHSIGTEVHGNGANMDNFETHDTRRILPRTCFSIEPGVYLPEFGVRSEINVFMIESGPEVTGEAQTELLLLG